jgi:hypothetical protein
LIAFIIIINYFQIKFIDAFVDLNSAQNSNNSSGIIVRNVFVNTNYKLTWINFTTSANDTGPDGSDGGVAQLQVSLPPQLRHRQQRSLPTRIRLEVVGSAASVRIRDAGAMHQGFYSAYKVLTHPNSSDQYVADRKDFYIYIKGLAECCAHLTPLYV